MNLFCMFSKEGSCPPSTLFPRTLYTERVALLPLHSEFQDINALETGNEMVFIKRDDTFIYVESMWTTIRFVSASYIDSSLSPQIMDFWSFECWTVSVLEMFRIRRDVDTDDIELLKMDSSSSRRHAE